MNTQKLSLELIECFGEDAQKAFHNNGTWEWSPDCAIDGVFFPDYCGGSDGCDRFWHEQWFITGYRIENGILYETLQSCDSDGNWEFEDECDVDDPNLEEWRKYHSYEESLKVMKSYYEWVLENNADPLGQFMVRSTYKRTFSVEVSFMNGKFLVENLKGLSKNARQFLSLKGKQICDVEWSSMDEFEREVNCKTSDRQGNRITIEFETDEPRAKKAIVADLRRLARKALRDR